MRPCYTTFLSLMLLSLCATAADPQNAKLSSPSPAGGSWIQEATLTATGAVPGSLLGYASAIDGDTVAVANASEVCVFTKSSSGWNSMTQTAILTPSISGAVKFGQSVAISGNTIVVGAPQQTVGSNQLQGAVYVFVKPAGGWVNATETAMLTASDGAANDFLGSSVAIDGTTIVAGAPSHNSGGGGATGTAYVYVEPAGGWVSGTQTAELTASTNVVGGEVGALVAISGNTVAAAAGFATGTRAPGGALIFIEPSGGWSNETETAVLSTGEHNALEPVESLALSSDTLVAGVPHGVARGTTPSGAVYVWVKPAAGWSSMPPTAALSASDGKIGDSLGWGVGLNGAVIVAGAPFANIGSNQWQGAFYVFNKPSGGWTTMTQSAKVTATGGRHGDYFGWAAGISGGTILTTAPFTNQGKGAAYIFGQ
jgi:hypothetical protein